MSVEKRRKAYERKMKVFFEKLEKLYPDAMSLLYELRDKMRNAWKDIGTYVGEEELIGRSNLRLTEDFDLFGSPFDFVYISMMFQVMLDRLEEELRWFNENREMLEILIREYEERLRGR